MDIETDMYLIYKEYMLEKSTFKDILNVFRRTPQSLSKFPTVVFREVINTDFYEGKSTDKSEYMDDLTFQVDIYTKDVNLDGTKYAAAVVEKELKLMTANFFRECGFERTSGTPADYIDITVNRYVQTYNGQINNWNYKIS